MDFSFIVITYDRAEQLRVTLDNLGELQVPAGASCECVVVDNNSADGTRSVVELFAARAPFEVRYVREPRQGTNHARNRGIEESSGDVVLFADDDMLVRPDWLLRMAEAFAAHPEAWAVVGPITPRFPGPTPEWLPDAFMAYYGRQRCGAPGHEFRRTPFEMNLGLRRSVFARVGGFSTRLCRDATTLRAGDGSVFFHRFKALGGRVFCAPAAEAFHVIPEHRACPAWLLDRTYWQGVTDVTLRQLLRPHGRARLLLHAICLWIAYGAVGLWCWLSPFGAGRTSNPRGVVNRCSQSWLLGAARQSLRERTCPS